jgi:hypothetical protein
MVYQFREGIRMPIGIKAQQVGESLEEIKKDYGVLNPVNVVSAASREDHYLHPLFEWDDTKAAIQYRLKQASEVVRAVCVKVSDDVPPVRAFVSVSPVITGEAGQSLKKEYQPIHIALNNADTRGQILSQAKKDLDIYHNKYATLIDVAELYLDKLAEASQESPHPIIDFYATFSANSKYAHHYVVIRGRNANEARNAMNRIYGKDIWDEILNQEEFDALSAQYAETQQLLTKLREINLLTALAA